MMTIIAIAIFLIYLIMNVILYFYQDKLIFQSVKLSNKYQFNFTAPFDEFSIKTIDNKYINALLFKTENATCSGLIIYFHGNADNLQRWGKYAQDFTKLGYDILMIDYRGYGKSSGMPDEEALYKDSELIWNWAKEKFEYTKWIIYGRSLGAAVASYLATKVNPDLLGLETPFDDLNGAMATFLLPFKLKYNFSTFDHLSNVGCKKFIIHGNRDWIVPISSALHLKPLLNKREQFVIIPKGGHRNLRKFEFYHEKIEELLKSDSL